MIIETNSFRIILEEKSFISYNRICIPFHCFVLIAVNKPSSSFIVSSSYFVTCQKLFCSDFLELKLRLLFYWYKWDTSEQRFCYCHWKTFEVQKVALFWLNLTSENEMGWNSRFFCINCINKSIIEEKEFDLKRSNFIFDL